MRKHFLIRALGTLGTAIVVGGTGYALLLGCAEGAPNPAVASAAPAQSAEVGLAYGGAYGKAVFIVYPSVDASVYGGKDTECFIDVPAVEGSRRVDCNSQYVVACDYEVSADKPFCSIVSEIGPDRESAYPKHKRQ